jgi:hypothetical protein
MGPPNVGRGPTDFIRSDVPSPAVGVDMAPKERSGSDFRNLQDVVYELRNLVKAGQLTQDEEKTIETAVGDADTAIGGLESDLSKAVSTQALAAPEAIGSAQAGLLATLASTTLSLNQIQGIFSGLHLSAKQLINGIVQWLLQRILKLLATFASHLKISGWSVTVTGGLPAGISIGVTVNFQ